MHNHKFHNSLDIKDTFVIFFIFCMVGSICVAREIYVDAGSQAETADGSKAQPFKTITEGLNIIKAGDTVIVREGIYRESVRVPGGESNNSVTLKAAEGERVVLSGAVPVTGWEKHRENVYVTVLDFKPEKLFVAYRPQPMAREPNEGWWRAMAVDDMTITDTRNLKTLGHNLVAEEAYVWTIAGNMFFTLPVTSLDRANGKLTVERTTDWMQLKADDRYFLQNHPSLIDSPGEWAVQEEGGKFRVYFQPERPAMLDIVEAPRESRPVLSVRGANYVTISGLEIVAGARNGIEVMQSENVVISNCISHNHGFIGIFLRSVKDVIVRHNISMHNDYGVALHTATNLTVEENEIAYNTTDGLIISWNSTNVDIRRNYIHHHLLWGHPDNIQLYNDVKKVRFIDNLLIAGGHSIMLAGTSDGLIKGNMIVGSAAYSVNLAADNYHVHNNTIAFTGYGCMNLRGNEYDVQENIFMTGDASCIFPVRGVKDYVGDRNLLYNASQLARKTVVVSDKGWHRNFPDYQRSTGYDRHSVYGDPEFRNAPKAFAVLDFRRIVDCTRAKFYLGSSAMSFRVGDTVEVDFDGVGRKVMNRNNETITVSPELRTKPLKPILICNWGQNSDLSLDLRLTSGSPGAKLSSSGGPVGSTIDINAYRRGDFNADGIRDLPNMPPELKPESEEKQDTAIVLKSVDEK
ncbi:MAG: right-handed parallel beta-helix repeat-containing protein [bacterium]|nr:MAG: right-handed parallel beta-helix repeat-containing protein [bacterium]